MSEASILTQNFGIIGTILQDMAIFLGVGMTLAALFQFKKYGEQRTMMSSQHSIAGPLAMLIAGASLLVLPTFIDTALYAFWKNSNPLTYSGDTSGWGSLVPPILMLVRLVGVGSFIRGIVMISRCGAQQSQPGQLGKAMMHIFAGILCVHILGTLHLLKNILGFTTGKN